MKPKRSYKKKTYRKDDPRYDQPGWLEAPDGNYYDMPEFKAYTDLVKEVVVKGMGEFADGRLRGPTVPEIHRILGDKAIPRWTLDALLQIDNLLDEGAPVRYRILDGPVKQPVSMRKLGINQKGKEVANEV